MGASVRSNGRTAPNFLPFLIGLGASFMIFKFPLLFRACWVLAYLEQSLRQSGTSRPRKAPIEINALNKRPRVVREAALQNSIEF